MKKNIPETKRLLDGSAGGGFSVWVGGGLNGNLDVENKRALKPFGAAPFTAVAAAKVAALIAISGVLGF